jgi:hypothetical protein
MDVYGFNLTTEQFTEGSVLLHDEDGSNIIQIGWEASTVMLRCQIHIYMVCIEYARLAYAATY